MLWHKQNTADCTHNTFAQTQMGISPIPCCSDNQLCTFNRKLETLKWDMVAWRAQQQRRPNRDTQEGFDLLGLTDGGGWDLLVSLMQYQPSQRLSASSALKHRWFGTSILAPVGAALNRVASSVGQVGLKLSLLDLKL